MSMLITIIVKTHELFTSGLMFVSIHAPIPASRLSAPAKVSAVISPTLNPAVALQVSNTCSQVYRCGARETSGKFEIIVPTAAESSSAHLGVILFQVLHRS